MGKIVKYCEDDLLMWRIICHMRMLKLYCCSMIQNAALHRDCSLRLGQFYFLDKTLFHFVVLRDILWQIQVLKHGGLVCLQVVT